MSTLRRLFSNRPLTGAGAVIRLDLRESHHGRHVLRLRSGDAVAVFDGAGNQFTATVERCEKKHLVVAVGEPLAAAPETKIPLVLYLALVKGETFDNVLQRAVELGVAEIVPFVAERTVPTIGRGVALERKIERWRQILLSATKQCGRARLTAITAPCSFADAIERPGAGAIRLCCAPDSSAPYLSETLRNLNISSAHSVAVMIGPEGGLTVAEIASARQSGWQLVSLGPRILRVETAATAALALVLAALGEI